MRKILFPLYVLYQVCFAWWIGIIATMITSILILVFGKYIPVKNGDYYPALVWCRFMCLLFLIPVKVKGRENVDYSKNHIFVANHQSMFDIFALYGYINQNFKWMMKDALRKVPILGKACAETDHIYVNRTTPQKDILRKAQSILKSGKSMTIFAEGTRTATGKLGRFKKGAFVVASLTRSDIIPIAIEGSYDIMPKDAIFMRWSPITVTFHKPIELQGKGSDAVDNLMAETRSVIAKTLGEE